MAKRRAVLSGKAEGFEQPDDRGYDVEMVRDFLGQLLTEVRAQHFENIHALKQFADDPDAPVPTPDEPILEEQLKGYLRKYMTGLVTTLEFDASNATPEELRDFMPDFLQSIIDHRAEQIVHLEALEELFDEALLCAKIPFGLDEQGKMIMPRSVVKVREVIDNHDEE